MTRENQSGREKGYSNVTLFSRHPTRNSLQLNTDLHGQQLPINPYPTNVENRVSS